MVYSQGYMVPIKLPLLEKMDSAIVSSVECLYNWKWDYYYDSNSRLISAERHPSISGGIWMSVDWRKTYTYDSLGNLSSIIDEGTFNSSWMNHSKRLYSYDPKNNLVSIINSRWDGNQWQNQTKTINTYNVEEKKDSIITYNWYDSKWNCGSLTKLRYDENENIILKEFFQCSSLSNSWEIYRIDIFDYILNGYLKSQIIQELSDTGWVNYLRNTLSYDSNSNIIEYLTEKWNGSQWTNFFKKFTFSYDYNNNIMKVNHDYNGDIAFYDSFGNSFSFGCVYEIQLFGNSITGAIENKPIKSKYSLEQNYPNPFNPTTTINYSLPKRSFVQIKLFGVLGNEIETIINKIQNAGNYELTYDASKLLSGIYFYRMESENFIETKKFILIK